jgi:glutamyl-tRNA synthetase
VENIIADIQRLGLRYDRITYTSDYFTQLKECGERLIRAGERAVAAPHTPARGLHFRSLTQHSVRRGGRG